MESVVYNSSVHLENDVKGNPTEVGIINFFKSENFELEEFYAKKS